MARRQALAYSANLSVQNSSNPYINFWYLYELYKKVLPRAR